MKYVKKIIRLYFSKRYSPDTERKIKNWLVSEDKSEEKEAAMLDLWDSIDDQDDWAASKSFDIVSRKLHLNTSNRKLHRFHQLKRVIAAAVIVLVCLAGGTLLYKHYSMPQFVTVYAALGETRQCTLPDGSVINLNSGSELKYPERFGDVRRVSLKGEAYFAVHRDTLHPFIVKSPNLQVKVLGTKFNVNDYPQNKTAFACLISGKVEVNSSYSPNKTILSPGEEFVYDKSTKNSDLLTNIKGSEEWIHDKLYFHEAPLSDIILALERRFKIQIKSSNVNYDMEKYTIEFEPEESLQEMLTALNDLDFNITWKKVNKQYIITYKPSK